MPQNELQKLILDKVVTPELQKIAQDVRAVVQDYDPKYNVATVEYPSPFGEGMIEMKNVPVNISAGGLHAAGPFKGDHVWISFMNGNPASPQITTIFDMRYNSLSRERFKHEKEGAYVPDSLTSR